VTQNQSRGYHKKKKKNPGERKPTGRRYLTKQKNGGKKNVKQKNEDDQKASHIQSDSFKKTDKTMAAPNPKTHRGPGKTKKKREALKPVVKN